MIIFAVLIALLITSLLLARRWRYRGNGGAQFLAAITEVVLLLALISVPISRYNANVFLLQFQVARAMPSSNALGAATGWQVYSTQLNGDLAEYQYLNAGLFDWWVPDEVDGQEPVL